MKIAFTLALVAISVVSQAQSENELINMVARICSTDSIGRNLAYLDENGKRTFQLQTPDYQTYGTMTYEYDDFNINIDVNSMLLFSEKPFGKLHIEEFNKKKSVIVLEVAGLGDRLAQELWVYSMYEFEKDKSGKWLLKGVNYSFEEYYPESKK